MQNINWHLGQAILPEHFTMSQQLSNIRNINLCQVNSATDYYGLAELKIDEHLLSKNILRLESLLYISSACECIYYKYSISPNNLEINLNTIDTDMAKIIINNDKKPLITNIDSGNTQIETKFPNISLFVNPDEIDEINSFHLLTLQKLENGNWMLGEFLAPLLTTNVYSFSLIINKLKNLLQTIRLYIKNERSTNSVMSAVKLSLLNNVTFSCNQLEYYILQIAHSKYSPIFIFHAIQNIYLYLLQYQEVTNFDQSLVYRHKAPLESFQNLITAVFEKILHTKSVEYKVFKSIDNILSTGTIEPEVLNRKKHYLVIRKPTETYKYSLAMTKLASPSRIEYVNKYSMIGLKLLKLDFNPLPSSNIDKYCDIYEILPSREWDYILNEQAICLLNTHDANDLKFVYYYV